MVQNKLFASLFVLLLASGFQYGAKALFGWSPDFVLGVLITFSFFLGYIEILFIGALSALLLNWKPYVSPEIFMLIALPLLVFGIKRYFPWRIELSHLLSVFFGIAVFYGISNYGSLFANPALFLKSVFWTLVFVALIFQIFSHFYPPSQKTMR